MIFHPSHSIAGYRRGSVELCESFRLNHRLSNHRLSANAIAADMLLPRSTMKKPHQSPNKKPLTTLNKPPRSNSIFHTAHSTRQRTATHHPTVISQCLSASST